MKTINHKSNNSVNQQKEFCLAEEIFNKLNQGSLFEIYQIIEKLEGKEEKMTLEKAFLERYHFDFRQYI
jgi:hypothetical protein